MDRKEVLGPRGIWGRVQGLKLTGWVNIKPLVCGSPSARSADARKARFSIELREKSILVEIPCQVEKVFTQILHVLHVKTTVGHRDLSQMASCQVWLSIAGV